MSMEFKAVIDKKIKPFVRLLDSLKDITLNMNIKIDNYGITLDSSDDIANINFFMDKSNFDEYIYSLNEYEILGVINIYKLYQEIRESDSIVFRLNNGELQWLIT